MENIVEKHFESVKKIAESKKFPKSLLPKGCISGILLLILFFIIWIVAEFKFAIGLVVAYFVYKYIIKQKKKEFYTTTILRNEFKNKILPQISKKVYSEVEYTFKHKVESKHIKESDLFETGIFDEDKEWIEAEDFFEGTIDTIDFQFFEMIHYVKGLTVKRGILSLLFIAIDIFLLPDDDDDDGGGLFSTIDTSKTKKNFRGFFLYADFHKSFDGEVSIKSKSPLKRLKTVFSKTTLPLVSLDNDTINKKFEVRASNEHLAYYLLNPKFLESIVAISNAIGDKLRISLKNGKLFLAIPVEKNFFENIVITNKSIKASTYNDVLKEVAIIKELLTSLHFNNRIWLKK